jgi:hypothetical protein
LKGAASDFFPERLIARQDFLLADAEMQRSPDGAERKAVEVPIVAGQR